jgi:hypothetical protein
VENDSNPNLHRITAKLCLLLATNLVQGCSKEVLVKQFMEMSVENCIHTDVRGYGNQQ